MSNLLEAIKSASQADLDAVEAEIANLENQLEALKVVQKTLQVRLHGKPERKKPGRKPRPEANRQQSEVKCGSITDEHRNQAYDYLAATGRPVKPMLIAKACNIPQGSISAVLDHEWFERKPEGVTIATRS